MKNPTPANTPKTQAASTIGGLWAERGLNSHLVAKIRPVTEGVSSTGAADQTYTVDTSQPMVVALLEDGEFSIEAQYSTPFESSNPEGRLPNLMGMIQSGRGAASVAALLAATSDTTGVGAMAVEAADTVADFTGVKETIGEAYNQLQGLMNRTNFTKLNSRQIYTSSNSVRISGTIVLESWANATQEVEAAIQKLQEWASPKKLSNESLLVGMAESGFTEGLFPSEIPPLVQLQYGGCTYKPLFIESISAPITAPMTADGSRIAIKCQITLLSLAAWDKEDIINLRRKG